MKYAHHDSESGAILGFYDSGIHIEIPEPHIELTDEEWLDCVNNNGRRRVNINNGEVVVYEAPPPTADVVAESKIFELSLACRTHITAGFSSDALGAVHTYPSNISEDHPDQQNLNAVVTESLVNNESANWVAPFWCADGGGVWDRREHNHAQIRAAGQAGARKSVV